MSFYDANLSFRLYTPPGHDGDLVKLPEQHQNNSSYRILAALPEQGRVTYMSLVEVFAAEIEIFDWRKVSSTA